MLHRRDRGPLEFYFESARDSENVARVEESVSEQSEWEQEAAVDFIQPITVMYSISTCP